MARIRHCGKIHMDSVPPKRIVPSNLLLGSGADA